MPETPKPDWKPLTYDEVIAELDKHPEQPKNNCGDRFNVQVLLVKLVKEGKAKAWLTPEGVIMYQYNPPKETTA